MLLFDFIQVACFQGSSIAAWTSFPFIVKLCFVGKKNTFYLFLYLLTDIQVTSAILQSWIINCKHSCIFFFLWTCFRFSGNRTRMEFLGYMITLCLIFFVEMQDCFPKCSCHFTFLSAIYEGYIFLHLDDTYYGLVIWLKLSWYREKQYFMFFYLYFSNN